MSDIQPVVDIIKYIVQSEYQKMEAMLEEKGYYGYLKKYFIKPFLFELDGYTFMVRVNDITQEYNSEENVIMIMVMDKHDASKWYRFIEKPGVFYLLPQILKKAAHYFDSQPDFHGQRKALLQECMSILNKLTSHGIDKISVPWHDALLPEKYAKDDALIQSAHMIRNSFNQCSDIKSLKQSLNSTVFDDYYELALGCLVHLDLMKLVCNPDDINVLKQYTPSPLILMIESLESSPNNEFAKQLRALKQKIAGDLKIPKAKPIAGSFKIPGTESYMIWGLKDFFDVNSALLFFNVFNEAQFKLYQVAHKTFNKDKTPPSLSAESDEHGMIVNDDILTDYQEALQCIQANPGQYIFDIGASIPLKRFTANKTIESIDRKCQNENWDDVKYTKLAQFLKMGPIVHANRKASEDFKNAFQQSIINALSDYALNGVSDNKVDLDYYNQILRGLQKRFKAEFAGYNGEFQYERVLKLDNGSCFILNVESSHFAKYMSVFYQSNNINLDSLEGFEGQDANFLCIRQRFDLKGYERPVVPFDSLFVTVKCTEMAKLVDYFDEIVAEIKADYQRAEEAFEILKTEYSSEIMEKHLMDVSSVSSAPQL